MTPARTIGVGLLAAVSAAAQAIVGAQAGTIQFAAGDVTLDGRTVRVTATSFPSWKQGQTLRTGRGRVEVLLTPGVFLRLGSQSSLSMESSSLADTRVDLRGGRALIEVVDTIKGGRIAIAEGETRTEFKSHGLYRFDADRRELQVYGGTAEVQAGDKKTSAGRGRAVQLDASLTVSKFKLKPVDGLFQWAAQRSFYWFGLTPGAWTRPSDWEITPTGWFWNANFDMKFFSPRVARRFRMAEQASPLTMPAERRN